MLKIAIFQFSLFGINTYVVYDEDARECAVVDPGMVNVSEEEVLRSFVERNSLKVTHLVNTHLHIDHAIGNKWVSETFGVDCEANPADAPLGIQLTTQASMFGLPMDVDGVKICHPLADGDVVKVGSGELKALHVPGHSPGGIALYDAADGFLISGDSLFQGSIGRTDLMGGNMTQLLSGIREKLMTLPDSTIVYPGHGPSTTIGSEKRNNPYLAM